MLFHDDHVILAKVMAVLHLDDFHVVVAEVFEPVRAALRDE